MLLLLTGLIVATAAVLDAPHWWLPSFQQNLPLLSSRHSENVGHAEARRLVKIRVLKKM